MLFASISVAAQAKLQSPDEFLGYPLGSQYTFHYRLVEYFQHIAKGKPEFVKLIQYGKTNEDRPLMLAVISDPGNMANIEEIRKDNLRKVGFESGTSGTNVTFVWISCSVHGNEPSGSESAMKTIYELVNADNATTKTWLKNTVVLMDISVNPDGYSRYTNWFKQVGHAQPNHHPESREHQEPWPGGRVNHYYFDLNRDWAWLSQIESQQRIAEYKKWMPHVVADLHEMGYNSPYYFAPAAQPYHQYITPWQSSFQFNVGRNNAKYFDQNGWLYFTREVFDLLYPSYGDTYPTYNGAIGMTYEQGGGPRGGRSIRLDNNEVMTLADRVNHHHTTSMATIEVASLNADKLCSNFSAYYEQAVKNPQGPYKTYIIKQTNAPNKIKELCKLLDAHKIKYGSLKSGASVNGFDYIQTKEAVYEAKTGDLVISAYQPMSVLTQILFDPENVINDSLTYDITAWGLPYAFGLDAIATKQKIMSDQPYNFPANFTVPSVQKPYAYLVEWASSDNVRFLSGLLQNGVKVRVAEEAFVLSGKTYSIGTLVITRADNKSKADLLDELVLRLAKENNQALQTTVTGFSDNGRDLGSGHTRLVDSPNIALVWDEDVDENAFGHIWSYLEKTISYPVSVIKAKQLGSAGMKKFNTVILPNGYYSLDNNVLDKLKAWVGEGGKLIALENAISSFEDKPGFNVTRYASKSEKEEHDSLKEKFENRLASYHHAERCSVSDGNPGAIIKNVVDFTHPLGYGLSKTYFSMKTNTILFGYLKDTWNVIRTEGKPTVIGFVGDHVKSQLKNVTTGAVQNMGNGRIVYLTDSPVFRGFWHQGELLMGNALFLAK